MREILRKNLVQRLIYCIIFLILIVISIKNGIKVLSLNSSSGIPYWLFVIVPGAIILAQIIFNSIVGWFLTIGMYSLYLFWTIIELILWVIEKNAFIDPKEYFYAILILSVLILLWFLIFLLKPVNKSHKRVEDNVSKELTE